MKRAIPENKDGSYPILHNQNHKLTILGRTSDDNCFMLLFPTMLMRNTSYWFFGLLKASVSFWLNLKIKFMQHNMHECQLLKNFGSLDDVWQGSKDTLSIYYNHFNKSLTNINRVISPGEFVRLYELNGGI